MLFHVRRDAPARRARIRGHSDLLAGVATTKDETFWHALRKSRELTGATPGTLECFLAVRGARTMALRLQRAQASAMELANRLLAHSAVELRRYPGLTSHLTHATARRVLKGYGTIISFDVRGGAKAADAVCARVGLIRHATSLGAVESTMERRAAIPGQGHLPPSLLRLSVGIEEVEDLWKDLEGALSTTDFEEAAGWAVKAAARPNAFPHIHAIAAYTLALAGALDKARWHAAAIRKTAPRYSLAEFLTTFPFEPEGEALFREGARRIGME